ncbi:type II toxin-antitoxin system HicA family toxin [Candidatus Micrarchaeota archaeon]|nr:type II toxin-antitoxin system HicA family toxin [Candidatus Micrarchaeota archaeon]MBI5177229.1 type II toxin-antitoxin system HicA family toxin [Candidatus Micrarchaeota archaeon]
MKLPLLNAKELTKILHKTGFELIRQEGSHAFFRHADGRTTLVPNHGGEDIDRGPLNKMIRKDLAISREDFLKYS